MLPNQNADLGSVIRNGRAFPLVDTHYARVYLEWLLGIDCATEPACYHSIVLHANAASQLVARSIEEDFNSEVRGAKQLQVRSDVENWNSESCDVVCTASFSDSEMHGVESFIMVCTKFATNLDAQVVLSTSLYSCVKIMKLALSQRFRYHHSFSSSSPENRKKPNYDRLLQDLSRIDAVEVNGGTGSRVCRTFQTSS